MTVTDIGVTFSPNQVLKHSKPEKTFRNRERRNTRVQTDSKS